MFKGHLSISKKQVKEINYAIMMYGNDIWGHDAWGNMREMQRLEKKRDSCPRCGERLVKE